MNIGTIGHYDLSGRIVVVDPTAEGFVYRFVIDGRPIGSGAHGTIKSPVQLSETVAGFRPNNVYVDEGFRTKEVREMCKYFGWTPIKFVQGMDNFIDRFIYGKTSCDVVIDQNSRRIFSELIDLKRRIEKTGEVRIPAIERLCAIIGADTETVLKLGAAGPDGDQALFYLLTCGLLKIAESKYA